MRRAQIDGRTVEYRLHDQAVRFLKGKLRLRHDVTDTEILVTICPLSSPHRTLAVQALCETLTGTATVFPGSSLTMRFAIHPRPPIGLAFPGPRPSPAPLADPAPVI